MRRIEIEGWGLVLADRVDGGSEPRIEDIELAKRLGFDRPRNIRKLIQRYEQSGELAGIAQRSTVERYESRPGVTQSRTVNVYELTEEQACFIAAKSDTPAANAVLREMIHVFVLARKGLLPQQNDAVLMVREVLTQLPALIADAVDGAVDKAIKARSPDDGCIGPSGARYVSRCLKEYAMLMAGGDKARYRSELSAAHVDLRAALQFSGVGRDWGSLPQSKWTDARSRLAEMLRTAGRCASVQTSLGGV